MHTTFIIIVANCPLLCTVIVYDIGPPAITRMAIGAEGFWIFSDIQVGPKPKGNLFNLLQYYRRTYRMCVYARDADIAYTRAVRAQT